MRLLSLFLATTILSVSASDGVSYQDTSIELYGFGLSKHFDNSGYKWNERNWGVGAGVAIHFKDPETPNFGIDVTGTYGTYRDSLYKTARFGLAGARAVIGNRNELHGTIGMNWGYYNGSGFTDFGSMPVASIGYNRFDICFTFKPGFGESSDEYSRSQGNVDATVVAIFLKIRAITF